MLLLLDSILQFNSFQMCPEPTATDQLCSGFVVHHFNQAWLPWQDASRSSEQGVHWPTHGWLEFTSIAHAFSQGGCVMSHVMSVAGMVASVELNRWLCKPDYPCCCCILSQSCMFWSIAMRSGLGAMYKKVAWCPGWAVGSVKIHQGTCAPALLLHLQAPCLP